MPIASRALRPGTWSAYSTDKLAQVTQTWATKPVAVERVTLGRSYKSPTDDKYRVTSFTSLSLQKLTRGFVK